LHEYTPRGQTLPAAGVSWTVAERTCEADGRRLCTEAEWQFACEGEAATPYPYGNVRDSSACNFDRTDLYSADGSLRDGRQPSGAMPRCASPFGVLDMVGNMDEWTTRTQKEFPWRSALRGGWWMPARNRCRAATTGHNELYAGPQTGFRCCTVPTQVVD
jgi:formylglycine-generating enzyme required for sulfatase activity